MFTYFSPVNGGSDGGGRSDRVPLVEVGSGEVAEDRPIREGGDIDARGADDDAPGEADGLVAPAAATERERQQGDDGHRLEHDRQHVGTSDRAADAGGGPEGQTDTAVDSPDQDRQCADRD